KAPSAERKRGSIASILLIMGSLSSERKSELRCNLEKRVLLRLPQGLDDREAHRHGEGDVLREAGPHPGREEEHGPPRVLLRLAVLLVLHEVADVGLPENVHPREVGGLLHE